MPVPAVEKPTHPTANAKEKEVVVVEGKTERQLILYRPLTRPILVDPIRGERPWCRVAHSPTMALFRCKVPCFHGLPCCDNCLRVVHEEAPFHAIQVWVENRWQDTTLHDAGYIHQLGHNGAPCLYPDLLLTARRVSLPDGEHVIVCRGCLCDVAAEENEEDELDSEEGGEGGENVDA
ncbi:hypothetical protein FB45DRAFT_1030325 [Roridomyces roridus]|uniref:Uncharacterized protein n=1 Tax=Roridomyces roridus TaxID=1738132 RepID=A0AAD7FL42_9AGAR|nr:hypothetical protein FB45DRAFT_1030325 [Roridomyces roridus]